MAHISRKLPNAFEGALAGGGDPATSPLYVFGPFLKLIVVAGVAGVTFGASVWMVVFTIAMVSAMYRLVMVWVTDGSGGSGLSEEEFGSWAVKVNAGITFVEYTLTFLVSMAAMVTFMADRFPVLNSTILGVQYRTFVAIILSLLTGWLVNRGPRVAARAFGPATAGVLLLLWAMVITTVWKMGLHLPSFDLRAFEPDYLHFTFGGYVRILAVMTGIEVFANLVAAYEGGPQERSKKAFLSLLIIMGTTAVTMLIVGPAIFQLSDPSQEHISVFTQAMDRLLPAPLPYLGTLVGVAVLLSASAASAQGLQNLALGLKDRNYIPAFLGQRNEFDVADKPVWIEVAIVSLCFVAFGTNEETYLAIYAAGVFILLSMTGWAAAKRLLRNIGTEFSVAHVATLVGTVIAALLTTGATIIIFEERFFEGAWTYFVFIPVLYAVFSYFRRRLGSPSAVKDQLGEIEVSMLGGFGLGQSTSTQSSVPYPVKLVQAEWNMASLPREPWQGHSVALRRILIPLDGSALAEQSLSLAESIARTCHASLMLVSVRQGREWLRVSPIKQARQSEINEADRVERDAYLSQVAGRLKANGINVEYTITDGVVANEVNRLTHENSIDLIVISTNGRSGVERWLIGSVANKVVQLANQPVLLVRPSANGLDSLQHIDKILVALDGSEFSERVLPYVMTLAASFDSEILLLSVPEVPETWMYGAMAEAVEDLRMKAEADVRAYLESIAATLRGQGLNVRTLVTGSGPARTIVAVSETDKVDLIVLATHGQGALDRLFVGNVADRVAKHAPCPVLLVPVPERRVLSVDAAPQLSAQDGLQFDKGELSDGALGPVGEDAIPVISSRITEFPGRHDVPGGDNHKARLTRRR